jgi:hypothetical protein
VVEPLVPDRDGEQSGRTGGVCCLQGSLFSSFLMSIRLTARVVPTGAQLVERIEVAHGYETSCILRRSRGIPVALRFTAIEDPDRPAEDTS